MRINPVITSLSVCLLAACSGPPKLPEPKGEFVPANPDVPSYLAVVRQEQVQNKTTINSPQIKQEDVKVSSKPVYRSARISLPSLANVKFTGGTDKIELVRGSGKSMSLYSAVQKIVPTWWAIALSDDVAKKFTAKVSWQGEDQWPYVLQRMLEENKLNALVDWNNSRVSIAFAEKPVEKVLPEVKTPTPDKLPKPTIQSKARDPTSPGGGDAKVGKNPFTINTTKKPDVPVKEPQPEIPKPVVKPAPEIKRWKIDKGASLKKGFELWVSNEKCPIGNGKWIVRWDTDTDYAIDYPLSFSSATFEGATSQLFNLYRKAQAPLYVSGYRNQCLIVISDRK